MTVNDGGRWLRKTVMTLSQNTYTSIDFWLSLPLSRLSGWIDTNNEIVKCKQK